MSESARITITSGPDRGKSFDLAEEIVHIGSGPENHLDLRDPDVADHQASIVRRNDRFAIYTPLADTIDVDGNVVPAEKWVWLPAEARIRLTGRTSMRFHTLGNGAAPPPPPPPAEQPARSARPEPVDPFADDEPPAAPAPRPASAQSTKTRRPTRKRRRAGRKPEETGKRQVARFITDRDGDTLVKLGEDGQLPELQLAEGKPAKRKPAEQKADGEAGSPMLYVALGFSILASVAMLLMDLGPGDDAAISKARARDEIRTYLGDASSPPEPYQRELREAILAAGRGDRRAEREAYRNVLEQLNAEDNNPLLGLTGSPDRDERLRELIGVMLKR